MKNKIKSFLLIMLLALTFILPVKAAEYGVVYDESEVLVTEGLEILGTQTLPAFTEKYGIDLRVDVFCDMGEFAALDELAEAVYDSYEYGASGSGDGLTLTLLVSDDGTVLEDWYVYAGGTNTALVEDGADFVTYILESVLTAESWENDPNHGATVLEAAVQTMYAAMESFAAENGIVNEDWMSGEPQLDHITDTVGILTEDEWQQLESSARTIGEQYEFGVYVIMVDDYQNYSDGSIFETAMKLYQQYSLGLGDDKGGLLLLLSMEDRDYSLITYGDFGNYAFNDAGREAMTGFFLDDFAGDNWYNGLKDYMTWSADYLAAAINETPYTADNLPMDEAAVRSAIRTRIIAVLLIPLVVAGIVVLVLNSKMQSVATATKAVKYISNDLELTEQRDVYLHTTETRTRKRSDSDSKSESSGGFSGTSGKF